MVVDRTVGWIRLPETIEKKLILRVESRSVVVASESQAD